MKVVTNRYNVPLLNKSTRNTALYAINNGSKSRVSFILLEFNL